MELSYLGIIRIADILDMKWSQISENGIFIQQGKTGVKQIKQWNYRLKRAFVLGESSKDKQIFSGHKTESQVVAYDRNVKITPTFTPKK